MLSLSSYLLSGCSASPASGDAALSADAVIADSGNSSGTDAGVPRSDATGGTDAAPSTDQPQMLADGGVNYADPSRWAGRMGANCPEGFQPVLDPNTSRCLTNRECLDPGTGGACRAYCANRNLYGPQPRGEAPQFECISSLDNRQLMSEMWRHSCDNMVNEALRLTTRLPIDCRCNNQLGRMISMDSRFDRCSPPSILAQRTRIGMGPGMPDLRGNKGYSGGYVEPGTRRLIIGGYYSDAPFNNMGLIFAIDLDTGARTVLSGAYNDPVMGVRRVGCSGTPAECASTMPIADDIGSIQDVKRGADGNTYAYVSGPGLGAQIWRVDLTTGRRTLVWREEIRANLTGQRPSSSVNTNQCWNGVPDEALMGVRVVQLHPNGWTMDAMGNHYFGVQPNGAPVGPNGIVRVSADGSSCTWVTRYFNDAPSTSGPMNAYRGQDLGTGNTALMRFDWRALLVHTDGNLYGRNASALVRINPATGDRIVVSNADLMAGVGRGAVMGDRWLTWDAARNRLWTTGAGNATSIVAVNLMSGDRDDMTNSFAMADWYRHIRGPLGQNFQLRGGLIFDPQEPNDAIIVHNNTSIVRYEVRTGNTFTLSY